MKESGAIMTCLTNTSEVIEIIQIINNQSYQVL